MLSVNCREGEPLYFISEKIVYDRKNLHIMIRVVTLPRCLMNRPGFPGECFICELRLPDHRF
ncbi:hypothetical protein C9Z63_25335 [Escherichia coli]|nr:hypothetical protein C9Z63_25335 [Escherichia coli]